MCFFAHCLTSPLYAILAIAQAMNDETTASISMVLCSTLLESTEAMFIHNTVASYTMGHATCGHLCSKSNHYSSMYVFSQCHLTKLGNVVTDAETDQL